MSKILVVQPHKILQHAIALSVFPQHQTRMTTSIPGSSELKEVDAVIIDAASLREIHGLSTQAIHSLQGCNIPIVWIDSVDSRPPANANIIVVSTPITKQSLQSALAQCLGELPRRARKSTRTRNPEGLHFRNAVISEHREVIDLVEVVEEAPGSQEPKG